LKTIVKLFAFILLLSFHCEEGNVQPQCLHFSSTYELIKPIELLITDGASSAEIEAKLDHESDDWLGGD